MNIFYTHKAANQLKKLPRFAQKRIVEKMRFFARQEEPLKFAKHLADFREGEYRFRIGDYRVAFDVKEGNIYVLRIGKRNGIYR